jgi:integrase
MKLDTAMLGLPEGVKEKFYFDDELKGFGLRLRKRDDDRIVRSWIVAYRVPGHQRRMLVGDGYKLTATQARQAARKLLAQVELDGDPQKDRKAKKKKDRILYGDVVEDFLAARKATTKPDTVRILENYLLGPKGKRATKAGMEAYLKPLHTLPLHLITRQEISDALEKIEKPAIKRGVYMALHGMFSWAVGKGKADTNPVNIGKLDAPGQRDRVLSNAELKAVWRGLDDNDFGTVVKLLVLTGCRREEIAGMRWSEFDDEISPTTWTLPEKRSKNRKALTLPVTEMMLDIIEGVPRRPGHDNLFGMARFTRWHRKAELDAKINLDPWTIHDLRRSVATHLADDLGIEPYVIEAMLNHRSGVKRGVAGTYNRSEYKKEVKAAMEKWSAHIRKIV